MAATKRTIRTAKKSDRRGRYDRSLSPQERESEQREALIAAATYVFGTKGYAGATVELIVERAHMSRRTFYQHFDDLISALIAVHGSIANRAFALLEQVVALIEDPVERVRVGVTAFLSGIPENPLEARVIFQVVRGAGPALDARWQLETARYVSLLSSSLAAAHALGALQRAPDEATVYVLVAGLEALAVRHLSQGTAHLLVDLAPGMADLTLRAFGLLPTYKPQHELSQATTAPE